MNILDAAKYLLTLPDYSVESYLTHLKLQQLCYYAQARSLVYHNKPLFDEHFEARSEGPINPTLYQEYKPFHGKPIPEPLNPPPPLLLDEKQILDEVWVQYGIYDAQFLMDQSRQEDPWLKARKDMDFDDSAGVIDQQEMKRYYENSWVI